MSKITDLIKCKNELSFSFEVTSEITENELFDKLTIDPEFFSIVWRAKIHQNLNLDTAPLKVAKLLRSKGKHVLLHLTCDLLTKDYLCKLLPMLREHGIVNLFIMLGENYDSNGSDFKTTEELIRTIREKTGDYFCIGVAGLPDCADDKLPALKNKLDAGADFILTQAFFEADVYKNYVDKCKKFGINIPVIPGIFYFENFVQLKGFIDRCKIKVSENILEYVKKRNVVEDVPGKEMTERLIRTIFADYGCHHFHFFTINKIKSVSTFCQLLLEQQQ